MDNRVLRACIGVANVIWLAAAPVSAATYAALNVAGSTATVPLSINDSGEVAGEYYDGAGNQHGFVWLNGTYTTFDPQGSTLTIATAVNNSGTVTGLWMDSNTIPHVHGFVRDSTGMITSFDAATDAERTYGWSINDKGVIGGDYIGPSGWAGFFRLRSGRIVSISVRGAAATLGGQINDANVIGGYYSNSSPMGAHAYIRSPGLKLTRFDAPGAGTGQYQGTFAPNINENGVAVGNFVDSSNLNHGYMRTAAGKIAAFDVTPSPGTSISAINRHGEIIGSYVDAKNVTRGFIRERTGRITMFSTPGSGNVYPQGTFPASINDQGVIAGSYTNSANVSLGFVRTP